MVHLEILEPFFILRVEAFLERTLRVEEAIYSILLRENFYRSVEREYRVYAFEIPIRVTRARRAGHFPESSVVNQ